MKKIFLTFICAVSLSFAFSQKLISVDSSGNKLKQFYLSQNVENLWLSGQHVNWETGQPDNPDATKGIKTHCSSFVASVCKQKRIYILRPPEHGISLLANAQFDWLFSDEGTNKGWKQIKDNLFETAQQYANTGIIVVAVCKNIDEKKPGHIAFIMPAEKTISDINNEGPTLIQAGSVNSNNVSLKKGFQHHLKNWPPATDDVVFFYNEKQKNKNN